jgi:hypothetical protein
VLIGLGRESWVYMICVGYELRDTSQAVVEDRVDARAVFKDHMNGTSNTRVVATHHVMLLPNGKSIMDSLYERQDCGPRP